MFARYPWIRFTYRTGPCAADSGAVSMESCVRQQPSPVRRGAAERLLAGPAARRGAPTRDFQLKVLEAERSLHGGVLQVARLLGRAVLACRQGCPDDGTCRTDMSRPSMEAPIDVFETVGRADPADAEAQRRLREIFALLLLE